MCVTSLELTCCLALGACHGTFCNLHAPQVMLFKNDSYTRLHVLLLMWNVFGIIKLMYVWWTACWNDVLMCDCCSSASSVIVTVHVKLARANLTATCARSGALYNTVILCICWKIFYRCICMLSNLCRLNYVLLWKLKDDHCSTTGVFVSLYCQCAHCSLNWYFRNILCHYTLLC